MSPVMSAASRHELWLMVRCPWLWAAGVAGVTAVCLGASLFFAATAERIWMPLVEYLNPGVDAPDNWALAITYAARGVITLLVPGSICGFVGLWRVSVRMRIQE